MKIYRRSWKSFLALLVILTASVVGLRAQIPTGDDFAGEDSISIDVGELDFQLRNLGEVELEGQRCRILELVDSHEENPAYPRMVMLVRHVDNRPLLMDYYNQQGVVIKTLDLNAVRIVNGVPTAMQMKLKSHQDGADTSINILINYECESLDNAFGKD
ncbi:MAG: outer membrane lipoprotein-sorting protein [Fidelibacterota bacterium]|nr:MAG: outer membrane lipoprotein-sorting protein [Candidatus Neomarinimicrobiota bacterium]